MSHPNEYEIHDNQSNDGSEGNYPVHKIANPLDPGNEPYQQGQQYNYPQQDFQQQQFQPQFQQYNQYPAQQPQQQFYQGNQFQQYNQQPNYQPQNFPQSNFQQQQFNQMNNPNQAVHSNFVNLEIAKDQPHNQYVQNQGPIVSRNPDFDTEWMKGPVPEEKRTKNDTYCLWVYLALLLVMIILVGVVNNQKEEYSADDYQETADSSISNETIVKNDSDEGRLIASSAIAVLVISFLISFVFVYVTPKIAGVIVWMMIGLLVFFQFLVCILFFSQGEAGGGVIFLFFALMTLAFIWCFRERIRQGIVLLKVASLLLVENLSILYVPVLLFVVLVFFLIIWLFGINGIGKLEEDNGLRNSILYFIYLLYWTMEILNGVLMVSISQISSKWYFTQNHQGQPASMGQHPIRSALKVSITYHLGSIALGASVMAFIQLVKFLLRAQDNQDNRRGNQFVRCLIKCIVDCIGEIVRIINKSAYIFMGQTGYGFKKSAEQGFKLVISNFGKYRAVEFVGDLYQIFGLLIIVLISGLIGYGIASSLGITDMALAIAVYVIISWPIAILFTSTLYVSTDCLLFWAVIDRQINGKITVGPPQMLEFDTMIHK